MSEPTVIKSVRMPASHWAFVAQRAKIVGIKPNAWMTRMVTQQMKKRAEETPATNVFTDRAREDMILGPQPVAPGSRLKKDKR